MSLAHVTVIRLCCAAVVGLGGRGTVCVVVLIRRETRRIWITDPWYNGLGRVYKAGHAEIAHVRLLFSITLVHFAMQSTVTWLLYSQNVTLPSGVVNRWSFETGCENLHRKTNVIIDSWRF